MPLEAIKVRGLREQVEIQLRQAILAGDFQPGERLPAIATIARQTAASYRTVQQALVRLQAQGLVSMRHGDGTYVQPQSPTRSLTLQDTVLLCIETQADVYGELHSLLCRELQQQGLLPTSVDTTAGVPADALRRAAEADIGAMIVHGDWQFPVHLLPTRTRSGQAMRVVNVLGYITGLRDVDLFRVMVDHRAAGRTVQAELERGGHRHILVVGTDNMLKEALEAPQQIRRATPDLSEWAAAGLRLSSRRSTADGAGELRFDPADIAALFAGEDPPTAVFGLRDVDAHVLQRVLLQCRPDLAPTYIGYGNTPHSSLSMVPFSTVDWNLPEVARRAVGHLTAPSDGPPSPARPRAIDLVPPLLLRRPAAGP